MPKPPTTDQGLEAQKNIEAHESILAHYPARKQDPEARSPLPPLPAHLDQLLSLPWTKEASRQVDLWLWYCQQEFEMGVLHD